MFVCLMPLAFTRSTSKIPVSMCIFLIMGLKDGIHGKSFRYINILFWVRGTEMVVSLIHLTY